MADRQSTPPTKVTLEDLLRLKRAERPASRVLESSSSGSFARSSWLRWWSRKAWWLELAAALQPVGPAAPAVGRRCGLGPVVSLRPLLWPVRRQQSAAMTDENPLQSGGSGAPAQPHDNAVRPARLRFRPAREHRRAARFRHTVKSPVVAAETPRAAREGFPGDTLAG